MWVSFLTEMFSFSFFFVRRSEFSFKFDNTFEIHDDLEVLKRMGLLLGEFY